MTQFELTSAIEDPQTTAQQFQVRTEEAQSVTEEAETLNEELQATNEELQELGSVREAERVRVSALLHSLEDAVASIGPKGEALLSNTAYRALLGEGAEAFLTTDGAGHPFPQEDGPLARAARGDVFTLAVRLPRLWQDSRWFEARGQPIRDAAGQTIGGPGHPPPDHAPA